jgi:uncharacterized protein (TIGR03083 family)
VDVADLLAHLDAEGPALAGAAERAGLDARVAACDWTVRDLVVHTGGVHRWAAAIVARRSPSTDVPEGAAVGTGPGDDELLSWFLDGHRALVQTLRDAPDDLDCAAFLPAPTPRHFWARRQAHETAMHRADAESAGGTIPPYTAGFAADGIAEVLTGFAPRRRNALPLAGRLLVAATDGPSWTVTTGGERAVTVPATDDAHDVTVAGTSSDLYLWLWNRPATVTIDGDTSLADQWRDFQVRWS